MTRLRVIKPVAAVLLSLAATFAFAQTTVFKVATIAPEGSTWMNEMRAGAKLIETRTDGRVEFKFYGGGVMGNDKKVMRKMRIGQLHGGAFVASGLAERYADIQLYGLPLLFRNQAEVDYVRQRMDREIMDSMSESGLVCLGIAGGGFANIMSAKPVRNVADLKGQKVWVPEGDQISYATMESLSLAPVTLPITDVLTGLQTGLVDIIGSSPVGALVLQWHTKVKFITDLPVSYLYGTMVLEEKAFKRLSASDQGVVLEVMGDVYRKFESVNATDNVQALAALLDGGIEMIEPDADLVPQWRGQSAIIRTRLAGEGLYSAKRLQRIDALLAEFRDRSARTGTP